MNKKTDVCRARHCERVDIRRNGLCGSCYYRTLTYGDTKVVLRNPKQDQNCSVPCCYSRPIAKNLCRKHYKRLQRNGDPEALVYEMHHTGCRVVGCNNNHHSKGFCLNHSKKWARGTLKNRLKKENPKFRGM